MYWSMASTLAGPVLVVTMSAVSTTTLMTRALVAVPLLLLALRSTESAVLAA